MKITKFEKLTYSILILLILTCTFCAVSISTFDLYSIQDGVIISNTSNYLNPPLPLKAKLNNSTQDNSILNYSLFGNIPIKSVKCKVANQNYAYLGGFPIGIKMQSDQMIISSKVNVVTNDGLKCPFADYEIHAGDILYSVNNIRIDSVETLNNVLNQLPDTQAKVVILRKNGQLSCEVNLVYDKVTNSKKLGLALQDTISGLGTMTFIDCASKKYGALGHAVKEILDDNNHTNGSIFNANIYNATAGAKGSAGELNGNFDSYSQPIGNINQHCKFGIFGNYEADTNGLTKVEFGDRYDITPGKAHIFSTVGDGIAQKYEIEIIKVNNQTTAKDKSMIIRVTDKRLIDKCGGIVQGMSGSPIIQKGKLVGAVTHVFLNDATKGYGLFIDWMR